MSSPVGMLVVLSGPSGVGKSTLLRLLFSRCPDLVPSVSATTRSPRRGEIDGVDYHFLSQESFNKKRSQGEFLETCQVYGRQHWYGTLLAEVAPRLAEGKWVVLEIDVEGTFNVLKKYPDALTIFVEPADIRQLDQRLLERGTETPEAIRRRLDVAKGELEMSDRYKHRVVNDHIEEAIKKIHDILSAAGYQKFCQTSTNQLR